MIDMFHKNWATWDSSSSWSHWKCSVLLLQNVLCIFCAQFTYLKNKYFFIYIYIYPSIYLSIYVYIPPLSSIYLPPFVSSTLSIIPHGQVEWKRGAKGRDCFDAWVWGKTTQVYLMVHGSLGFTLIQSNKEHTIPSCCKCRVHMKTQHGFPLKTKVLQFGPKGAWRGWAVFRDHCGRSTSCQVPKSG